jgi:perosamine synthetase
MIPVFETVFLGREKEYLEECIKTRWISSEGPFVKRFEQEMATRFGMQEGVAVSNGTAALEVALYALDLAPGSEVIMPSFTIISCALACLRLSLVPIFVDIDPVAWTMDPRQVRAKLTAKTGAIMPVHIYGNPVDMDPILQISREHGIPIMEDFAEAHGAVYLSSGKNNERLLCGGIGDVSATSFYANKIITCGEGGMVLCRTQKSAERARRYRNLCFDKERKFIHEDIAGNFRMTNMQAAIGLAQLEQLDKAVEIKRSIGALYREALAGAPGLRFHPIPRYSETVYWMYCCELAPSIGLTAEDICRELRARGIDTRYFFTGMHRQPVLRNRGFSATEDGFPRTDHASRYGFYLPSSLALDRATCSMIAATLIDILRSHGRR